MISAFDELATRRVVLVGGKGGVGKTTISIAAALHYSESKKTILFTTDPASNLSDLDLDLRIESLDANALYARFLKTNLESFLEIGDRGTYLDREELRRFFELSLPGVDELMAWMRIGELAEENPDAIVVVDTAPTGHTMRMLSSSDHFRQFALALDAMQEKHRAMVRQFTRREVRDAIDAFIEDFDARTSRWRSLLEQGAFVPVTLAEPLVIEQTQRLIAELAIDVPFVVLNRARGDVPLPFPRVVRAPQSCVPLDTAQRIQEWSIRGAGGPPAIAPAASPARRRPAGGVTAGQRPAPLTFLAGKGGVGKTTIASSLALNLARNHPDRRYVIISVDPAHSLRDVFAKEKAPNNLAVEAIDTKAKWLQFRERVGEQIVDAVDALAPRGMSLEYDTEAMRRLVEIAPPGADELFAITRLADLAADASIANVIVDTAPTGHFLRLLDLPQAAGEWVREFMRILLRYKDLVPPGSLGEELVRASRALKELDETLRSDRAGVIVVTRPERIVIAETQRLIEDLRRREIRVLGVIANYVTPENDDPCDQSLRAYELEYLDAFPEAMIIERHSLVIPSVARDLGGWKAR